MSSIFSKCNLIAFYAVILGIKSESGWLFNFLGLNSIAFAGLRLFWFLHLYVLRFIVSYF